MPAARVERWFLRVMLGVSVVAWLALLLAELGQFRLGLLALLLTIGAFGLSLLVYAFRASPATPTAAAGWLKPALAATAGILLCAALFLPPYETAVQGGDATVYLNFGRQIARHGALEFEDALLRPLSIASRAELFLNRVPGDVAWTVRVVLDGRPYSRFPGGFLIPDIVDPTVTTGFSPLFPVLTALGHALVSPQGALVVAPLFATLSLIGLWCVARRLGGVRAAWLAAALTAVSLPQIWFAKLSVPETVAQCFVMAGVLAWLVATARGAPRWACAAGWFLGLACFAKVDLIVLLTVFLLAVVAVRLLARARPDDPPLLLALLAAFGLLVAHNLAHYLSFTSHYKPYVAYLIRTSEVLGLLRESALLQAGAALAAGLLVAAGVVGLRRPAERWPRLVGGLAAVGALVVYGAAYVTATTGRLDETITWLSWYVSWPVLGLAALGLAGLEAGTRPARCRGAGAGLRRPAPRCRRPAVSVRPAGDRPADRIDAAVRAGRPPAHDALRRPDRRRPAGARARRQVSGGADPGRRRAPRGARRAPESRRGRPAAVGRGPRADRAGGAAVSGAGGRADESGSGRHAHPDVAGLPP